MLKVEGIQEFNAGIDAWLKDVNYLAVTTLRGLAVRVFETALANSPQFSGNVVANWKFSVDGVDTSHDDFFKDMFWDRVSEAIPLDVEAFSKENPNELAEVHAKTLNSGKELGVKNLANIIYISNSVDYSEWLRNATLADLRKQNHIGHTISQTVDDVIEGHLFITTAKAQELALERIG